MCDKAVKEDLCLLEYVPDWFVRQEQIELWGDAMTIATMISLLNGTRVIKIGRLKKQR